MKGRQKVVKGWRKRWELQRWHRLLRKFEDLQRQRLLERLDELQQEIWDEIHAEKESEDGLRVKR